MNSAIYTCDSIVPQRNHFVYQPPHIHVHVFGLTGPWDLKSMVSSVISIPVLNLHSIESDTKANNIMFCGRYLSLGGEIHKDQPNWRHRIVAPPFGWVPPVTTDTKETIPEDKKKDLQKCRPTRGSEYFSWLILEYLLSRVKIFDSLIFSICRAYGNRSFSLPAVSNFSAIVGIEYKVCIWVGYIHGYKLKGKLIWILGIYIMKGTRTCSPIDKTWHDFTVGWSLRLAHLGHSELGVASLGNSYFSQPQTTLITALSFVLTLASFLLVLHVGHSVLGVASRGNSCPQLQKALWNVLFCLMNIISIFFRYRLQRYGDLLPP